MGFCGTLLDEAMRPGPSEMYVSELESELDEVLDIHSCDEEFFKSSPNGTGNY